MELKKVLRPKHTRKIPMQTYKVKRDQGGEFVRLKDRLGTRLGITEVAGQRIKCADTVIS
jgi:hypothetical protein